MAIEVNCNRCNKSMMRYPCEINKTGEYWCSRKCRYPDNEKRIVNCLKCNKESILIAEEVTSTLRDGKYISCSHCGSEKLTKEKSRSLFKNHGQIFHSLTKTANASAEARAVS